VIVRDAVEKTIYLQPMPSEVDRLSTQNLLVQVTSTPWPRRVTYAAAAERFAPVRRRILGEPAEIRRVSSFLDELGACGAGRGWEDLHLAHQTGPRGAKASRDAPASDGTFAPTRRAAERRGRALHQVFVKY
jgi:hypothetical protein